MRKNVIRWPAQTRNTVARWPASRSYTLVLASRSYTLVLRPYSKQKSLARQQLEAACCNFSHCFVGRMTYRSVCNVEGKEVKGFVHTMASGGVWNSQVVSNQDLHPGIAATSKTKVSSQVATTSRVLQSQPLLRWANAASISVQCSKQTSKEFSTQDGLRWSVDSVYTRSSTDYILCNCCTQLKLKSLNNASARRAR